MLEFIMVGNYLQSVADVVVQFGDSSQPIQHCQISLLDIRQQLEYQYAHGQRYGSSAEHQRDGR